MDREKKVMSEWLIANRMGRDFMLAHPIEGIESVDALRSVLEWFRREGFLECKSWPSDNWTGTITDAGATELNLDGGNDSWLLDNVESSEAIRE